MTCCWWTVSPHSSLSVGAVTRINEEMKQQWFSTKPSFVCGNERGFLWESWGLGVKLSFIRSNTHWDQTPTWKWEKGTGNSSEGQISFYLSAEFLRMESAVCWRWKCPSDSQVSKPLPTGIIAQYTSSKYIYTFSSTHRPPEQTIFSDLEACTLVVISLHLYWFLLAIGQAFQVINLCCIDVIQNVLNFWCNVPRQKKKY